MCLIDGMQFYGGETDTEFIRITNELDRCPHLETFGECDRCCYYEKCFHLFECLSARAAYHRLKEEDVLYFRDKYLQLAGIMI